MSTVEPPRLLPHLWRATLASGVLAIILGALVLWHPGTAVLTAAIVLGIYLLVTGFAQLFFAFTLHVSGGGRVLLFISGAASLVLAMLAFRHFNYLVILLAIWIAVAFIFRGIATTLAAISDPHMPGRWWQLFLGIITWIAGIVVIVSPVESIATLTLVAGIWLIVIGAFEIVSAFGIRSATKKAESLTEGK
jgi:uncharacterized membrane protein HdeD (DUF308 family)